MTTELPNEFTALEHVRWTSLRNTPEGLGVKVLGRGHHMGKGLQESLRTAPSGGVSFLGSSGFTMRGFNVKMCLLQGAAAEGLQRTIGG